MNSGAGVAANAMIDNRINSIETLVWLVCLFGCLFAFPLLVRLWPARIRLARWWEARRGVRS